MTFKVGDKVRVVRKIDSSRVWNWVPVMDELIGQVGEVTGVKEDFNVFVVKFSSPPSIYGFVAAALELAISPEVEAEAQAIIRDATLFRAMEWFHERPLKSGILSEQGLYRRIAEQRLKKMQEELGS